MNPKLKLITLCLLMSSKAIAGSVSIQTSSDHKKLVLADKEAMTVYTFKPDKPNESKCFESCAETWPPVILTANEASELKGSMSTFRRPNGDLQLTVDGHPVYRFKNDKKPGDTFGQGLGNIWFVIDLNIQK